MRIARRFLFLNLIVFSACSISGGGYRPTKEELREIVGSYWVCPKENGQTYFRFTAPADYPADLLHMEIGAHFEQINGANPFQASAYLRDGFFEMLPAESVDQRIRMPVILEGRPPIKMTILNGDNTDDVHMLCHRPKVR